MIYIAFFKKTAVVATALLVGVLALNANAVSIPEDPTQSIRYWKPQVLAEESDAQVALAHQLFGDLLGAWDISRVEPSLNVVRDTSGPWAASLADGNILLSRAAIDTCMSFGEHRGKHLLAFILAHELAHQKGNDLWHQQFFRLIGNQSPERTQKIKQGLSSNVNRLAQIEELEAQADHDAVVMMASVGFDPYQIVKNSDFYTAWVESIWKQTCNENSQACVQAKQRALRTHAQLESISDQSILYELGVQSLVANQYSQAREYLTAYARNFPGRAVHNSVGVSYLAEAINLWPEYAALTEKPSVYFPLFIEAKPAWQTNDATQHRGSAAQIKSRIDTLTNKALNYFEKAQRLSPDHKHTHYLRALSYLLLENPPMAKGIIDGQYIPKFGNDSEARILQGISATLSGDYKTAQTLFKKVQAENETHLTFSAVQNQAHLIAFLEGNEAEKKVWRSFAKSMGRQGESYFMQLALGKLKGAAPRQKQNAFSYGNITVDKKIANTPSDSGKPLWFEGEPLALHRDNGGAWVTDKSGNVIALWLGNANLSGLDRLKIGDPADRVIPVLGVANRQIQLNSGIYLAFDDAGIAVHIKNNKIYGWFVYPSAG